MTIKDLARLSGYSLGTVSRVLNNQPNVSDKARETIMAIVKEAGFEPNNNAKNLKQQRSNSIVVIVKGRANELFAHVDDRIKWTLCAEFPFQHFGPEPNISRFVTSFDTTEEDLDAFLTRAAALYAAVQ